MGYLDAMGFEGFIVLLIIVLVVSFFKDPDNF